MAYKYSKDKNIFDEVVNSISANNKTPYKTNNRVYEIYDAKHNNSSVYNQNNDFLKQIDTYSNNYAKQSLEKEQEEYYNKNKDELIKQRTNSLIYNWDVNDSGGARYNYNGSKDTSTSDFYTNLGVNDLSLNNFLVTNEEAENKKKSKMWQQQEEIKNRFKNIGLQNTEEDELDSYFKSIGDRRFTDKKVNPYENDNSYYKKYIEKFNTSIKEGNIKAANNALQNINKKYFGADYSDGMLHSLLEGMRKLNPLLITNLSNSDEEDASILEQRFNNNVKKLEAINSSINNGVDDATLNKLEAEKSRLEFENQLIQYNKLTTLYSVSEDSKRIDEMYKKVEDPFKNIDLNLKWDKDKSVPENIINNYVNLYNTIIQSIGATGNAMMEMSFNSITDLLTNDMENEDAKMFTAGIIDFAEYLVPYVGQAKLYIDTASSGSVAWVGLYDNLIAKPLGLEEQSSAILGDNPSDTQTFGACMYVAMNFVLDKMISNSSLGKFAFDGKTQEEISKMTFGNIMKALGITSFSEGLEEFFQAYGEDMMYGDKDRSIKDVIANKETFKEALRNMFYAIIVSGGVGGVQVGTSKARYHNSITTDTKYAHVNNDATSGINVDSTSVEKVDNTELTETIVDALQSDKSVDIISTDIDGIDEDLTIDYNTTPTNMTIDETTTNTNTDTTNTTTNTNTDTTNTTTFKSNIEAITFDSTEKTILETLNNPKYYEAKGLSESPTLQEVYDLLLQYNDPITEKLFYYNELYGNRKYSTFINNLNNGKITPELVADKVLPANNSTKYSPNDIKNNTVTTVVPSQEMANFILSNNPNADVEVLDVKSPTFNEDVKNYVNGKATYNLNLNKKVQNEKVSTTVDSKTVKNLNTELTDLNNTLSKVEAEEDTPISKIKIDNSALASGNFADISNNVQENLLNTLDTENYSTSERREALSKTLSILNKYNDETRTPIKQKGGKPIVFDKTGFNTYETSDTVSTDTPAIVNSTGKFIYGNSDAKLNLSERAVNKINNMIDKLDLNGDKLTTRSTHKDVAELVNKNKDMAKEILQVLGYDGVLYGKQKTKLIAATDNNDSVDIDKALNKTSKKIDDIMAAEKNSTSKEDFIARMQIAKETLGESTKTKPVKIGSKQLDSTKSNIKVESDLKSNKLLNNSKNGATFEGKPFWSGSVSLIDGVIEETHTYEEASNYDFSHLKYFSESQIEKMDNGENAFFWIQDGKVEGVWRDEVPNDIIEKIKKQIQIKTNEDSNIKVESDLNRVNNSITEAKVNSAGSDIKNTTKSLSDEDYNYLVNNKRIVRSTNNLGAWLTNQKVGRGQFPMQVLNNTTRPSAYGEQFIVMKPEVYDLVDTSKLFNGDGATHRKGIIEENPNKFATISEQIRNKPRLIYDEIIINNNTKFEDVVKAIDHVRIPKNSSKELISKLESYNIPIEYYTPLASNNTTKEVETPTPIPNEVTIKTKNIEIKGNPESISVDTLQDIDAAFDEVSVHSKKSAKELKNSFAKLYSAIFDRYSPILKIANDNSNLDVKNAVSDLWTLRNRVHNNIKVEQTDINGNVVGKSLDTIKKQIKKQDLNDFQKCIRAALNVERINNSQDRVLNLDAKKSQQYYESLIKKHPYFKNVIDDLRVWNTNNTQKLFDAGLINAKQKQALDNSYQIYAPIYSAEAQDFVDIGEKSYNTRLKANDTLKPTTKQGKSILDIWTAFVVQEQNLENSILKNNTYKAMADSKLYSIDTKGKNKNSGTDIIYYDNGKINKFTTNKEIAQVFQKYNIEKTLDDIFSIPVLNWFPKLKTKVQQKMLTSYDPIYTANNMFRDFGDSALFYSKYPLKFAKNYARAAYNVANNSVLYQEIVNTGIVPKTSSTNKFMRILTSIESLPKMAEYMSAIESGKTPIEAKLEAQDVNLNFARGGYATQALNSKGWLFLNASAQALDKTVSTIKYDISKVKENPIKGSLNLLMKVGAMSTPAILNALMNQDDDDYEKLPYYYKNNYYMIKLGDNSFLRIPKGRIVGLVDTLVRYASGIDKEIDLKTYLESIHSSLETSILPQDLIGSSPFGEIEAIKNNKNYYGAEIYDEDASLDKQLFDVINYISMNVFGRYGKAFKNLMDGDSTTDIWDVNSYVFDSTKYDKNLSNFYTLKKKYTGLSKDADFNDRVYKKYIDSKYSAINSISHDIKEQKANGATLEDMKDLYQMRDALTKDTLDNYNKYTIDKSGDKWIIYFDDATFTYDPKKDEFKKLKN